jgi:hypothetical protein
LRFRVTEPGTFRVRVVMAACSREPCGFVLQAFTSSR